LIEASSNLYAVPVVSTRRTTIGSVDGADREEQLWREHPGPTPPAITTS
jgi:hypothetical protein